MTIPYWMSDKGNNYRGNQRVSDLNKLSIDDESKSGVSFSAVRRNLAATDAKVEVVITDIRDRLVQEINTWSGVLGCMAWLTDSFVLQALSTRTFVSIIVQKEDFLRPDVGQTEQSAPTILQDAYSKLPVGERYYSHVGAEEFGSLSYAGDPTLAPIRVLGVRPDDPQQRNHPRMHHKFMVFGDWIERIVDEKSEYASVQKVFEPQAVWTGSFNPTNNGSRSLENAVLIHSEAVAQTYAREHAILLATSEPLNWSDRYVAPEWRMGS